MYLFGYRYLGDGDTDRREILHDGIYGFGHKVTPLGIPPRGPKIPNFNREYLENWKSQRCQVGRNIGSTRAFQKCITWDGSCKDVLMPTIFSLY